MGQRGGWYSNPRSNPTALWKKESSFSCQRVLNSQVWAQSPSCDMLTKRKNVFSGICLPSLHFHSKLFQGASWKASQIQCSLKATSLMTDERVPESFCISSLAKILKSQLTGKEHASSSADAAEHLTVTYCIYSVAYSPAPASCTFRRQRKTESWEISYWTFFRLWKLWV